MSCFESDAKKKEIDDFNLAMDESKKHGIYHKAIFSGLLYIEGDINKHPNIIKVSNDLEKLFGE